MVTLIIVLLNKVLWRYVFLMINGSLIHRPATYDTFLRPSQKEIKIKYNYGDIIPSDKVQCSQETN